MLPSSKVAAKIPILLYLYGMLLAPDPVIIDLKFTLKLKKGHYENPD